MTEDPKGKSRAWVDAAARVTLRYAVTVLDAGLYP